MKLRVIRDVWVNMIWPKYLNDVDRYMWFVAGCDPSLWPSLVSKKQVCWKAALQGNKRLLDYIYKCGFRDQTAFAGIIAGGHQKLYRKYKSRIRFSESTLWWASAYWGKFVLVNPHSLADDFEHEIRRGAMHPDKSVEHVRKMRERFGQFSHCQSWELTAVRYGRLDVLQTLFPHFDGRGSAVIRIADLPLMQWCLDHNLTFYRYVSEMEFEKATPEQLQFALEHGWDPNVDELLMKLALCENTTAREWLESRLND